MKRAPSRSRVLAFLVATFVVTLTLFAFAAPPKPPARKPVARPAQPARPPQPRVRPVQDAGVKDAGDPPTRPLLEGDGGPVRAGSVDSKTLDGGAKVYRFGEVEIEGRLKSPQIVYFLRRVRAEFAAGDLGHRTFMKELSDTRNQGL